MKKILLLILEINSLVFAWYVFMGLALIAIDGVSNGFLERMGVARQIIYWIVGISALLEGASLLTPKLKKAPKLIRARTRINIRDLFSFSIAGASILWGSFWYYNAHTVAELGAQGSGLPPIAISGIIAAILCLGIFINAHDYGEKNTEPENTSNETIKELYKEREESSIESKKSIAFPLWRYVHETEYTSIVEHVPAGTAALDNGCGDGTLAIMLAKKGVMITACDISEYNIAKAKRHAVEAGMENKIRFVMADAENLPFEDSSFDWVISSHILEHLPSFEKGLAEVRRVTKSKAVIALPTCLNPCAAVILGEDVFWEISRWSPFAWFVGCGRILANLGSAGVDEGYRGNKALPHIWRYPHVMRKELRRGGFEITAFQASSLCLPYFPRLIPLAKKMERFRDYPFLRNCGYGSIAVLKKTNAKLHTQ